jgi:hypothetical protein
LLEFLDGVYLKVDVESLLGEVEVTLLQTRVPVPKGHNVGFDRWIVLKFLQEFSDAVFLGVDVESQIGEAEVSALQTRVALQKGHTF